MNQISYSKFHHTHFPQGTNKQQVRLKNYTLTYFVGIIKCVEQIIPVVRCAKDSRKEKKNKFLPIIALSIYHPPYTINLKQSRHDIKWCKHDCLLNAPIG